MSNLAFAAYTALLGGIVLAAAEPSTGDKAFVADFDKHWSTAKILTLAIAEAMPPADYSFKPTAAQMSFGEQMIHIAESVNGYCAFVADAKPAAESPKATEKAEVLGRISSAFDYCTETVKGIRDGGLDQMHGTGKGRFDTREVLFGLLVHLSHHRGQAEVYLRLKGITPPEYKW